MTPQVHVGANTFEYASRDESPAHLWAAHERLRLVYFDATLLGLVSRATELTCMCWQVWDLLMWQELHLEPTLPLAALHDRLWPTMLELVQVRLLAIQISVDMAGPLQQQPCHVGLPRNECWGFHLLGPAVAKDLSVAEA